MTSSANQPIERFDPTVCGNVTAEWLVSVRDEQEFAQAVRFGVDVVDLKEPRLGALAPVSIESWERAVWLIEKTPTWPGLSSPPRLSAALGEGADALPIAARLPAQFSFAKTGPSDCATAREIRRLWNHVGSKLRPGVELVAVAYADAKAARCIDPEQVLLETRRAGMRRCLIDTFTKDGRSSVQQLGLERLRALDQLAQRLGIWWALAGSISRRDVGALTRSGIKPNCFAVRGDVCSQDRKGTICNRRMQAWSEMFAERRAVTR